MQKLVAILAIVLGALGTLPLLHIIGIVIGVFEAPYLTKDLGPPPSLFESFVPLMYILVLLGGPLLLGWGLKALRSERQR